jgi:hypothetical protein
MAVKCGNCKGYHDNAAGVKECYQGAGFGPVTATIKAEAAVQAAEAPATEKQLTYLLALLADRPGWAKRVFVPETLTDPPTPLTKRAASYWIGEAKKIAGEAKPDGSPTPTGARYMPEIEDGIYKDGAGTYWKVYHTIHGNNSQVAKKLIIIPVEGTDPQTYTYEFEYVGKRGLKGLTTEMRLDEAAAKEFGKIYGFCVFGHALNRDESLYVGYGKTCAAKNGWWYPTKAELRKLREAEAAIV